jgi:transposase
MSLQWCLRSEVPEDTAELGRMVLAPDNIYRQIGDRFNELWPDQSVFAPMYCDTGRGAIPPLLLSLVTVFQMQEKLPDRVAAQMVASRIDWKYALHLPLTYPGFHFTDLLAFRQRLEKHGQERLVFDEFLKRLQALGLIRRRPNVRTDSTHVLGRVHRLGQLELVTESIRVALRAALKTDAVWCDQAVPPALREAYDQRQEEYGLSDTEVKARLLEAGKDGFWFLAQVDRSAPEAVRELAEVATLRTVLQQQFPDGPERPPAKRPSGGDIIESPHETQARVGRKRGQSWLGYKVQLTETHDADRPRLIVDLEVTGATANDSPELSQIQQRLEERRIEPKEQRVDQSYVSAENLVESAERGIELLGIPLADTSAPEGFRQTDFEINEEEQEAICPAGHRSAVWSVRQHYPRQVEGLPATQVRFAADTCQQCAFFAQCTTSRQGRSLMLHPYRHVLQARREEAKTEAFLERLRPRAGIEGTVSELVRGHDMRQARYRGEGRVRLQGYFTATAANLKRSIRWLASAEQKAGAAKKASAIRPAQAMQRPDEIRQALSCPSYS